MNPIEDLLRREIGLDAASVGSSLIERTIRLRMQTLGLQELSQYRDLLAPSQPEWEELIEAVVVTETWFFRDREAFSAFVQLVQQEFLAVDVGAPVRILSVPCSTGEEPYSLAMALLDAGVRPARFMIDAVDLSSRALERAQQAVYGRNSFRGPALASGGSGGTGGGTGGVGSGPPDHMGRAFRDRHFVPVGDCFKLYDYVRERVTFQRGNLLAAEFLGCQAPYDFIFCRNLLIYFDRATQARTLRKLRSLLAPRGVLFVGPAEMPLVSDHGFAPAGFPMAFACRKAGIERASRTPRRVFLRRPASVASPLGSPAPVTLALPEPGRNHAASRRGDEAPLDLNNARALADAGRLVEATAICEAYLKVRGPSAQAYYLIGLAHDAHSDPAAMDFYRKAIYLEPNHYEALLQISLLLQRNGDVKSARTFKRRAERLRQQSTEQ